VHDRAREVVTASRNPVTVPDRGDRGLDRLDRRSG
jgi:hypothetical protein